VRNGPGTEPVSQPDGGLDFNHLGSSFPRFDLSCFDLSWFNLFLVQSFSGSIFACRETRALIGSPPKDGHTGVLSSYLSEAINRRSRCGFVRGRPVLSSHFSPGFAPHVGQRTARASFCFAFIAS
jgi:hypothetical protein